MSQKSKIFLGVLAAAGTLAAMQMMSAGEAVSGPTLAERFQALTDTTGAVGIDRDAKADLEKTDREIRRNADGSGSRTVLLRVEGLSNTSVFVRIPVETEKESRNVPALPAGKPADAKPRRMVACEPVVSVLTDVAKLLQPGRCVT